MSCPTSETLNLEKLRKEIYESMPKKRLVEIAIEKSIENRKLSEDIQALRQLVRVLNELAQIK
jgi:hypothetical protein